MKKTNIRVRYNDTDMMGIVHHSVYLQYSELIREDFMEDFYPYHQLEKDGLMMPIRDISVTYFYPTRYGDNVHGVIKEFTLKGPRFIVTTEVYANDVLSSVQTITLATVETGTFKPINIKKRFNHFYQLLISQEGYIS